MKYYLCYPVYKLQEFCERYCVKQIRKKDGSASTEWFRFVANIEFKLRNFLKNAH